MLTWQHTDIQASVPAVFSLPLLTTQIVPVQRRHQFPSVVPLSVCVTQLLPACYLEEHIPCRSGHPSEERVALIRRCHLPGAGIDLAWRERRSDSPATKIRPFRRQEERLTPPPLFAHKCTHTHPHTNTKSKRAVGQSVRMQLGPVSADLVDEALHVEKDWGGREWQVEGRGGAASV